MSEDFRRSTDAQIATILEKVHNIEMRQTQYLDNCKEQRARYDVAFQKINTKLNNQTFEDFYKNEFNPLSKTVFRHVIYWSIMITLCGSIMLIFNSQIFALIRKIMKL